MSKDVGCWVWRGCVCVCMRDWRLIQPKECAGHTLTPVLAEGCGGRTYAHNMLTHPLCLCVPKTIRTLLLPPVQLTTGEFSCPPKEVWLKGIVHLKMKMMASSTHSHVIPNLYGFLFFPEEHKRCFEQLFCPYSLMKVSGVKLRHFSKYFLSFAYNAIQVWNVNDGRIKILGGLTIPLPFLIPCEVLIVSFYSAAWSSWNTWVYHITGLPLYLKYAW